MTATVYPKCPKCGRPLTPCCNKAQPNGGCTRCQPREPKWSPHIQKATGSSMALLAVIPVHARWYITFWLILFTLYCAYWWLWKRF